MDLTVKNKENVEFMLNKIFEKLKLMSQITADTINEEKYEDLVDLYNLIMKRDYFSPAEMEAIAEELGNLRNS